MVAACATGSSASALLGDRTGVASELAHVEVVVEAAFGHQLFITFMFEPEKL